MDPIVTPKKEQTKVDVQSSSGLVPEQQITPEMLSAIELARPVLDLPVVKEITPEMLSAMELAKPVWDSVSDAEVQWGLVTPPIPEVAQTTESVPEPVSIPEVVPDVEIERGLLTPPISEVEQPKEVVETIPEVVPEKVIEQEPPQPIVEQTPPPRPAPIIPVPPVKPVKDKLEQEIEDVMEEDLKDMYLAMSKEKQVEFRNKGDETLSAIRQLVVDTHKNVKKIFQLIRAWLKIIPGVNRYFLEQEAKIKTDKILFVSEEEKRRGSKL